MIQKLHNIDRALLVRQVAESQLKAKARLLAQAQGIIDAVAMIYGLKPDELLKKSSPNRAEGTPRLVAMYLIQKHTTINALDVCRMFNAAHGSVHHAYKKINGAVLIAEAVGAIESGIAKQSENNGPTKRNGE